MAQESIILFPFLQKVYSALKHLDNFSVSNDFFDNISDLDGFFSEFRSSTLVLQKSLGGPDDPVYDKNLKDYLTKDEHVSRWMNTNRINAIHKHPFDLCKHLNVTVYSSISSEIILKKEYSVKFDEPFDKLQPELKELFDKQNVSEVNFSVCYSYTEKGEAKDVFVTSIKAIESMLAFMQAMIKDLNVSDSLSIDLSNKIIDLAFSINAKHLMFVRDYCYLIKNQQFVHAGVLESNLPDTRMPIEKVFAMCGVQRTTIAEFDLFVLIHAKIYVRQRHHIMSTFFVKYTDDTVSIVSFDSSLRTTFYRKINEIANIVLTEDVISVYFVSEFIGYGSISLDDTARLKNITETPYLERRKKAIKTMLSFYQIDKYGTKSIFVQDNKVREFAKLDVVANYKQEYDEVNCLFLTPIVSAFRKNIEVEI